MKTRIWCKRHRRWHSLHADYHCKVGHCTPEKTGIVDGKVRRCTLVPRS